MKAATEKEILGLYRQMRTWVERERRRLAKTGERPSQQYLRRSRLLVEIDERTLRELMRELLTIGHRHS